MIELVVITIRARQLNSWSDKSKGLLGSTKPENVYFKTRWGVHTFFMKFAIDVVILDRRNVVVNTFQNLKPWKIFLWNPKFNQVLELPQGTVTKLGLNKGNKVALIFTSAYF